MAITIDHFPGRTLETAEGTYTYFGGTAYLGLQTHPVFLERYKKNLEVHGTTYAASRHANVQLDPFTKGEQWLAGITGAENALYVSSGFSACQLMRKHFSKDEYHLFFAPHTHAALLFPGDRVHENLETLKEDILKSLTLDPVRVPVLFFDTVDFSGSNPLQFDWLESLPLQQLILVADDSHAIGITGERGGGSFRTLLEMQPAKLLVCGSMGKGFGIAGGFILGSKETSKAIAQDPWFGGSGPGTAAGCSTLLESEALLEEQRGVLHSNIALFLRECEYATRFAFSKGYPCFTVVDNNLPGFLEENGIVITNFHYPNAHSPLMCKIVISAFHTENDILQLAKCLNTYYS